MSRVSTEAETSHIHRTVRRDEQTAFSLDMVAADLSGTERRIRIDAVPLAAGGDGAIHRIEGEPALLAKLYHAPEKDPARLDKLKAMLAAPPDLPAIETGDGHQIQIAWPSAWIEDHGRFRGYVMPAADLSRATALETLLARRTRMENRLPESYGYRLSAAANLAAVVAELHAHGHHIIDLKPVNLHVYTDTFYIAVLDCDGFSVQGHAGVRFPAHQFSDGYICPEALQQNLPPKALGENQDRFALAVILFQLLNQGIHPFQGVPVKGNALPPTNGERVQHGLYGYGRIAHPSIEPSPWSIHSYFDDATRRLFDRAFTRGNERPSASEWHQHLRPYATKKSGRVRICAANPEHLHFSVGCPWCELEDRRRGSQIARTPERRLGQRLFINGEERPKAWGSVLLLFLTFMISSIILGTVSDADDVGGRIFLLLIAFMGWFLIFRLPRTLYDKQVIDFEAGFRGQGPDYIRFEPHGNGNWELSSVRVEDHRGVVEGRIEGLKFFPERRFADGVVHTVQAKLHLITSLDFRLPIKREWHFQPGEKDAVVRVIW